MYISESTFLIHTVPEKDTDAVFKVSSGLFTKSLTKNRNVLCLDIALLTWVQNVPTYPVDASKFKHPDKG